MAHQEFIREVPGSTGAVLLIHGILGTPNHFRQFLHLIPENWSVYNILLDGHGGSVDDFSRTSMKKWKSQVAAQLDDLLNRYETVIITAHSMGSLFAIDEAVHRPEKIGALFLLQVPTRPRLRLKTAFHSLLFSLGVEIKDPSAAAMREDCGVELDKRLWKYIGWLPRFLELFGECRRIRKMIPRLCVPCQAYQSRQDELVSMRSTRDLQQNPNIQITILEDCGHFGYFGQELQMLQTRFSSLFFQ